MEAVPNPSFFMLLSLEVTVDLQGTNFAKKNFFSLIAEVKQFKFGDFFKIVK